jgi:hypothetical protein
VDTENTLVCVWYLAARMCCTPRWACVPCSGQGRGSKYIKHAQISVFYVFEGMGRWGRWWTCKHACLGISFMFGAIGGSEHIKHTQMGMFYVFEGMGRWGRQQTCSGYIRNLGHVLNHLSVPLAVLNVLNALSQGISRHFKTVLNLLESPWMTWFKAIQDMSFTWNVLCALMCLDPSHFKGIRYI